MKVNGTCFDFWNIYCWPSKPILGVLSFLGYPLAPPQKLGVSRKSVAKSADVRSWIAQLLDHPQKWFNTLWKVLVLTILKSTGSFLSEVCEPSNSRLKSINFIAILKIVIFNILSKFYKKSLKVSSRIAQLTDHPPKWACTLWKGIVLRISKSTEPFLWVACEPSYWQFNYP